MLQVLDLGFILKALYPTREFGQMLCARRAVRISSGSLQHDGGNGHSDMRRHKMVGNIPLGRRLVAEGVVRPIYCG